MSNTADLDAWQRRASQVQAMAAPAYARLLALVETRDSGQVRRIAGFLASTFDGQAFPFDPFELRAVNIAISDDMLACLDALRWGKADSAQAGARWRAACAGRLRCVGTEMARGRVT